MRYNGKTSHIRFVMLNHLQISIYIINRIFFTFQNTASDKRYFFVTTSVNFEFKIEATEASSDWIEFFAVSDKASINSIPPLKMKNRRKTANDKCYTVKKQD